MCSLQFLNIFPVLFCWPIVIILQVHFQLHKCRNSMSIYKIVCTPQVLSYWLGYEHQSISIICIVYLDSRVLVTNPTIVTEVIIGTSLARGSPTNIQKHSVIRVQDNLPTIMNAVDEYTGTSGLTQNFGCLATYISVLEWPIENVLERLTNRVGGRNILIDGIDGIGGRHSKGGTNSTSCFLAQLYPMMLHSGHVKEQNDAIVSASFFTFYIVVRSAEKDNRFNQIKTSFESPWWCNG